MSTKEMHLDVYENKSILYQDQSTIVFLEGKQSANAQNRYIEINRKLKNGYLDQLLDDIKKADFSKLSERNRILINDLVNGVTSELGRAIVGVTFLQLTVKSICPEQSIRLHKGNVRSSSFSWQEGISMRSIDSHHITPFLRREGLLKVNKYGVFMTRSLAENYPYTKLYKADMKGPFDLWLDIIDAIENGGIDPKDSLLYLTHQMKKRSEDFCSLANETVAMVNRCNEVSFEKVKDFMMKFVNNTDYSARAFEVVIHGFMQAMNDCDMLGGLEISPLSQMRLANKKHGNVGDVELCDGNRIVEAWDAKYGKAYLRDELEELFDKIRDKGEELIIAGFIVNEQVDRRKDINDRATDITTCTGVEVKLLSFDEWLNYQMGRYGVDDLNKDELAKCWLTAVVESFALKRPLLAPIDEPCEGWLRDLQNALDSF